MATPRAFGRGSLPNQIEFDPTRALSTAGGNGDLYRGILHLKSHPDGSPFEYHNVALKRMRWGTDDKDTRLRRIIDESYVWQQAIHRNILRFIGLLFEDGELYLVAPFAPHGTLSQYIVAHPDTNCPMLLWHVSAGITHLHEKEIIHGDVKGANILIFDGPIAKICDFGLSKVFDGKQTTNSQYSLPWTSPERLLGEPRSFSSDVYAFGMTIYEILSGKIPFDTLDYFACIQKICVKGEYPPKHPVSSSTGISYALLWALAERCWQVRPDERPSMNEVCALIAPAEASLVTESDLDGMSILSFSPAASDIASPKRKLANSTSNPTSFLTPNEPSRNFIRVIRAAEAAPDVESRRDVMQRKLQGEGVTEENMECRCIVESPAVRRDSQQDTAMSTWVGVHRLAPQPFAATNLDNPMDELRIVGATVVRHHELKNIRAVWYQNYSGVVGFWKDIVEADVIDKRSLVKMYPKRSGGEKAFLRDLERLGNVWFGLPRVRAYCLKGSVPFIVLEAESIRPLKDHLLDSAKSLATDIADRKIWSTITKLNTAANFVHENCEDILKTSFSAVLEDARVDQHGEVVLAPRWSDKPDPSIGSETVATGLTRIILQKLLMSDHDFHRFSCISFTFGAGSWNYMTREDVLELSDEASAKAHLCAHAGASSPPESRDAAKVAYGEWMKCSCLSHNATPRIPTEFMAPKLLALANPALRLGLSLQAQSEVSNFLDVTHVETTVQPNAKSYLQSPKTLPLRFWALLLIADESQHIPGAAAAALHEHDRKRQEATHAGARPHFCQCGKEFSHPDALHRHSTYGHCPIRDPSLIIGALNSLHSLDPDLHSIQSPSSESPQSVGSTSGPFHLASSASGPALLPNQSGHLSASAQARALPDYFLELYNLKECGALDYTFRADVSGPGNRFVWKITIRVDWTPSIAKPSGLTSDSFVSKSSSKKLARQEAARQILECFAKRNKTTSNRRWW